MSATNNTIKKNNVNRPASEYVKPFDKLPVPQALHFANQSWNNERLYGVARLAIEAGASQAKIAEKLNTDPAWLSRFFKRRKDK